MHRIPGALPPFFLVSTNASSAAVSVKPLAAWEEEGATDKVAFSYALSGTDLREEVGDEGK